MLLNKGADTTIQDNEGKTAYDVAANNSIKQLLNGR
jgi:hypothetical protein